jgi:chromosome segregation ATPase
MLTARKLEKIIELEDSLRSEYQAKLDAQSAEIERAQQELAAQRQQLQATIDKQLETITDLSDKATAGQRVEQLNRELTNRSEKLQEEVTNLKKRVKALQKDLAAEREQVNILTQYDPARMKKNLDANKKKLAEKTTANDLLQKTLNKTKAENAELQRKVQELESKLPEPDANESTEEEAA